LIIIDMINEFAFHGAEKVETAAYAAAGTILRLRDAFDRAGEPVIYVNDNFGEWHSERSRLVEKAEASRVTERIRPREKDYFVIKPQFSGFYASNLAVLLPKLGVGRLVLTGIQTDICVLFTAGDAHMRDYALWIPSDGVAAETSERGAWALEIMRSAMNAETASTAELSFAEWKHRLDCGKLPAS